MLTIVVPETECFDEMSNEFLTLKEETLHLEHSLLSLSKWESNWQIPFLGKDEKTTEQTLDYIKCMTVDKNIDSSIYSRLTTDNIKEIRDYIESPMTATTFSDSKVGASRTSNQIVTSELIYNWMILLNIPFECQKWHLNRLLTLIKVCNIQNTPNKKMSRSELLSRNASLNAQRLKSLGTKG